jgi:predicted GH43/DUF377 family glycosyl hydrolase
MKTSANNRVAHDLFSRHPDNPILSVKDWPYPANSVFNAAAAIVGDKTVLLVRVEDFRGFSHLTVARSDDGVGGWVIDPAPTLKPDPEHHPEEIWGIEDPRLTWLAELETWAATYTAFSHGGPLVSLATTKDFREFTRLGPVMPPEDKDAALFPVRFNGRWAMFHRPAAKSADIWISFSPDLKHWGDHQEVIRARSGGWWDANKIGLSAPPLQTPEGWLILYHSVRTTASGSIYRLGLALLDLNTPERCLKRSNEWIFGPEEPYERRGDVDNVIFPCGYTLAPDGDTLHLYYGAADSSIALATGSVRALLEWLG